MGILSNLEPKRVFEIFEEMCAIPHGSTNTKAISDWCVAFGEKLGLEHYQDEANNVILIAPATPGYEDAPAVILQGHVDMVCEKEAGCAKDMDKEGLDLFVDGDLVGAKGTTLGGDDGIAVAMALAALEEQERRIVVLHAVTGLKHREIAQLLELPLATVLSKYHRALKKLKVRLEGDDAR